MDEDQVFVFLTPEEIASLPAFPELESDDKCGGSDEADGNASGPGYAYLVAEEGSGKYFKVGRTVDPVKRLKALQTGHPRKLIMKPVPVSDMAAAERDLLQTMREKFCKADGGTEWFIGDVTHAKKVFTRIVNKYRN